jgi:hypothetical protein
MFCVGPLILKSVGYTKVWHPNVVVEVLVLVDVLVVVLNAGGDAVVVDVVEVLVLVGAEVVVLVVDVEVLVVEVDVLVVVLNRGVVVVEVLVLVGAAVVVLVVDVEVDVVLVVKLHAPILVIVT